MVLNVLAGGFPLINKTEAASEYSTLIIIISA
jgi:hypothetical protein